jgi:hypothetical protein
VAGFAVDVVDRKLREKAESGSVLDRKAGDVVQDHIHDAIYDLADVGESRFLVLELVEGKTLAERVAHGVPPIGEASQIADALEAAQCKGVTHRESKLATS